MGKKNKTKIKCDSGMIVEDVAEHESSLQESPDPIGRACTLEYNILSEKTYEDLIVSVNKAMEDNWDLVGGVSSTPEYNFIQAMSRVVYE